MGQPVCIHLSCSQSCWDVQQRCAARGGPATRERSSSRCWCRCGGCEHTSRSGWRSGTGSTWVWWRKRWRSVCHPSPWCLEFCSWPALSLAERKVRRGRGAGKRVRQDLKAKDWSKRAHKNKRWKRKRVSNWKKDMANSWKYKCSGREGKCNKHYGCATIKGWRGNNWGNKSFR